MSPLDRDIHVREIVQDEFDKFLVSLLAKVFDKRLRWQLLAEFIRSEAILSKRVVKGVNC